METPKTLVQVLQRQLKQAPDALALSDNGRTYSYTDLDTLSRKAATWLRAQGIGKGDRVAVWLVNRVEWLALLFGITRIGATMVVVNPRYSTVELQHILSQSQARLLIFEPSFRKIDFLAQVQQVDPGEIPELERIAVLGKGDMLSKGLHGRDIVPFDIDIAADPALRDDCAPDALAVLFATSGTTKLPKLVMHTHGSLAYHTGHLSKAFAFNVQGARCIAALPFCGVFGLNPVLASIYGGAPVSILETFDGKGAAEIIQRDQITHIFAFDEAFHQILKHTDQERPFSLIRLMGYAALQSGGVELARKLADQGVPIFGMFGASEVNALFSKQPQNLPIDQRIQGGGMPVSGDNVSVRVRDPDSGKLVATGERGLIEIRGPSNFAGYFRNPKATAEAIDSEGYYNTGDIGFMREDGSFVYEARLGDVMRLSGFLVNPSEIEDMLSGIDGVEDSQVIGVEIDGKPRCVAFVIADKNPTSAEQITMDAGKLMARYKVPSRVWFLDDFPITPSANGTKIQRAKMRQMAIENLERGDK